MRIRLTASCVLWVMGLGCSSDLEVPRGSGAVATTTAGAGAIAAAGAAAPGSGAPVATLPAQPTPTATTPLPAGDTRPIGDDKCAAISETAKNQLQPADVVWAIDNSGSMSEEMQFVREHMNAFSQQISMSGIDVRIIMLSDVLNADMMMSGGGGGGRGRGRNGICIGAPLGSGMCPDDSKAPNYLHVPQSVGSHDALDVIVSTYSQWQAQMRPNATKSFVLVTDDNAIEGPEVDLFGNPVPQDPPPPTAAQRSASFVSAVKALDATQFASFKVHGIYPFTACAEAAAVGEVYNELVQQTGGLKGDLCLQDFKPVLDELARGIVQSSGVACNWTIPPAPIGTPFEVGKVNLQYTTAAVTTPQTVFHIGSLAECPAQGGWYYDDNAKPNQISVCPATCDAIKNDPTAKVDILFGCATLVPQ